MVVHAYNPSTWEAEGGELSSRPAWSTKWVPGKPGLYRENLSQNKQTNKQNQARILFMAKCLDQVNWSSLKQMIGMRQPQMKSQKHRESPLIIITRHHIFISGKVEKK